MLPIRGQDWAIRHRTLARDYDRKVMFLCIHCALLENMGLSTKRALSSNLHSQTFQIMLGEEIEMFILSDNSSNVSHWFDAGGGTRSSYL